ncbi:hypothetical protein AB6A40_004611 [Gnathostoma spinigerum]|uniref:Uncharacterized protein n=1 Tax=Gnathostoma spinigerum TaxID=75299 RepID=A0ABD6EMW0_9BILA
MTYSLGSIYGFKERAAVECRTVDPSFFADVVSICPIPATQSHYLHLLATTRKGVRLYFTCHPYTPSSAYTSTVPADISQSPYYSGNTRPCCLRLRHLRIPPGFGSSFTPNHPIAVYDSFSFHDCFGMVAESANEDVDTLWVLCSANFPCDPSLSENLTRLSFRGPALAIDRLRKSRELRADLFSVVPRVEPSSVVMQHRLCALKLVLVEEEGLHIYEQQRPIDILREVLRQYGPDSPQALSFFHLHGPINICVMALMIMCLDEPTDVTIKELAVRTFFSLGSEIPSQAIANSSTAFRTSVVRSDYDWAPQNTSVADWTIHMKSPLHASTPHQSVTTPGSRSSVFNSPMSLSSDNSPFMHTQPKLRTSYRHDALYTYFSRIVSDRWSSPLCHKMKDDRLKCTMELAEIEWLCGQLSSLKKAISEYSLLGSVGSYAFPAQHRFVSSSGESETNVKALAINEERRSLLNFLDLLRLTEEVLQLWRIVCEHQFHVITSQLPLQLREQLCTVHFSTLVVTGLQICSDLITCLIRHYIGDNATTSSVCEQLRTLCPSIFSDDDAVATKATEMLEEVRHMEPCAERDALLAEAVRLLTIGVQKINLPLMCNLLYRVNCMEGIVQLVLARAEKDDSKLLALVAYRSRAGDSDQVAQESLIRRKEAYKCITDALDKLTEEKAQKTGKEPCSLDVDRDIIINAVLRSKDELACASLFKWLIDNNLSTIIIQSKSPFVEAFLHRRLEEGGSPRYLDLLWRFHERSGDFYKAAVLLDQLAAREGGNFDIDQRVAYLSQAAMCAQSATPQQLSEVPDFLSDVRDKLEVAQIQLRIKNLLSSRQNQATCATAIERLNSRLFTVQELFEEFAAPFNLPEIKLALCHCSATYNPELILELCMDIVERELTATEREPADVRIQRLSSRLSLLSKQYSSSPKYFPLEDILVELMSQGIRIFPPTFLDTLTSLMSVPFHVTLDVLMNCYRRDPFWRTSPEANTYIMRATAAVIARFCDAPLPIDQRHSLASKCLDLIATLTVQRPATQRGGQSDSVLKVTEYFRALQCRLESF